MEIESFQHSILLILFILTPQQQKVVNMCWFFKR